MRFLWFPHFEPVKARGAGHEAGAGQDIGFDDRAMQILADGATVAVNEAHGLSDAHTPSDVAKRPQFVAFGAYHRMILSRIS
jgi:hypothetical protein